jgi:uncharacterized membrane protein YtjA (UPF0391 family)
LADAKASAERPFWEPLLSGRIVIARQSAKGLKRMSTIFKWALVMLLVSLVAALFGFTGISAASADIARILFYIFIVLFVVLLVLGLTAARTVRGP